MIPDSKFIRQLVEEATAVGSAAVLKELRPKSDDLTYYAATQSYKKSDIDKLLANEQICFRQKGARNYLSRLEINQALCQSSVQLLFVKMYNWTQQTAKQRGMGCLLGRSRKTRKM